MALPQFIAQLVDVGARDLREAHGFGDHQAACTMMRIAGAFCDLHSKNLLYVPEMKQARTAVRNARIYAEWTAPEGAALVGKAYSAQRVNAIAEQHDLTTVQVYSILKDQRALQRQGDAKAEELLHILVNELDQAKASEVALAAGA